MAMRETKRRSSSPFLAETCSEGRRKCRFKKWRVFRKSSSNFSLEFPVLRPSDQVRPMSKVFLRCEGYAWAPVFGSFEKLHEVGVFSYLVYFLFKCFVNGLVDLRL